MVRRAIFRLVLGLSLVALLLTPTKALAEGGGVTVRIDKIDVSKFPDLQVDVTIFDVHGSPVLGLEKAADNFAIVEDGRPLPSSGVTSATNPDMVIAVAIAIDISGSMQGDPIIAARTAANNLLDRMGIADKAAVVAFNGQVDLGEPFPKINPSQEADFTSDKGALRNLINTLDASGRTALYDACFKAVKMTSRQSVGNRAVVLFTDGSEVAEGERAGILEPDDCITEANRDNVPVFTIGLGSKIDREYLQRVALLTGGQFQEASDPAQLASYFQNITSWLKTQYHVRYTSQAAADNADHSVHLRVKAPGGEAEASKTVRIPFPVIPVVRILAEDGGVTRPLQDGQTVQGTVKLKPEIFAQGTVTKVEYYADGVLMQPVVNWPPYSYDWNTRTLNQGSHKLIVQVYTNMSKQPGTTTLSVNVVYPGQPFDPVALLAVILLIVFVVMGVVFLRTQRRPAVGQAAPLPIPSPEEQASATIMAAPVTPAGPAEATAMAFAFERRPVADQTVVLKPAAAKAEHLAWLIITGGEMLGKSFRLLDETTIGRAGTSDIILSDAALGRQQAKVKLEKDDFVIYDMAATNPTLVNGKPITTHRLKDGDKIELGQTTLTFLRVD